MKPLLIVYNQMNTGGIETLILRFAHYMRSHELRLHVVLTRGGGSLMSNLERVAQVRIMNPFPPAIPAQALRNDAFFSDCQEVFVMCPEGNALGLKIAEALQIPFKVGVFHPEDYGKLASVFYRRLFDNIPDECKLFMNEDCLTNHNTIFNRRISGTIWPLPVITEKPDAVREARIPKKNTLISIGRFDPFKTYNLTTIRSVARLRAKGLNLHYDLYGYGLLEDKMKELIKALDLGEQVFLRGTLRYDDLQATVRNAYVFVGCGTAAIEASYAGVPTIIAALETDGLANGLFTDPIGFNIGERSETLTTQRVEDLIEHVLSLPDEEYRALSERHTRVAKERYEATSVFNAYFNLPEIRPTLQASLKTAYQKASWYSWLYKTYKWGTKTFGLQTLKRWITSR